MVERKLLVSNLTIGYEGLFDAADLFKLMDDWFSQHNYDKNEARHVERVSDKGKFIDIEMIPLKDINDYTRYEIHVRTRINNMTETKIKRKEQEFKINNGKISIVIDVFLTTDTKNRMEARPMHVFFRTIFNKFINKEYITKVEKDLMNDVKNFHSEIKSYLNLERYKEMA